VVANAPAASSLRKAEQIARAKTLVRGTKFTLLVSGWLTGTRGLGMVLAAAKALDPARFQILMAGDILCPEAVELSRLSCVNYLGVLSLEDAVALNYASHLVACFYDPAIEINRLAEPNKWQDCLATRTPFVTNVEILTAKRFIENHACFAVEYGNDSALIGLLQNLINAPEQLERARASLAKIPFVAWDDAMGQVLSEAGLGY
jgi:hypothetical protein